MSHGYATANALSGLAAAAFTWSSGYAVARTRLNDGILDEVASGSAAPQASGQTHAALHLTSVRMQPSGSLTAPPRAVYT